MAGRDDFERVLLRDVVKEKKRELVQFDTDTLVKKALDVLMQEQILAAPVYDREKGMYVAFTSVFDITAYLTWKLESNGVVCMREALSFPLGRICPGYSAEAQSGMWIFRDDASVAQVLEPLGKGVHRVLVLPSSAAGGAPMVLTQTDVARYILLEREAMVERYPALSQTLEDLGFGEALQPVVRVSKNVTAREALVKLFSSGQSALAVVEDRTTLLATLSPTDLRGVNPYALEELERPVLAYLARRHGGAIPVPVCAQLGDTLLAVFERMAAGVA
eukprot:CAMPEP_0119137808 /NCGR_PEP_ID=MMETSP1310-20130426/24410_1 /TAXON_ID=464262 /ORGANISM="Genus nov. species nov., Strain RCC2339" /LENGTH=275 /DNA_ID=CAMNT_0007128935 /DNA_START=127 /DNA_END=950 /DNA_ORIENTATION=-